MIRTARLRLIPAAVEHFEAMREGDAALGRLLGLSTAEDWVGLVDHREFIARGDERLKARPGDFGWWTYLFVHDADAALIGVGGLKGEPKHGEAEIGYALAPSYRGRGLAIEAARALADFAFADPRVERVTAHTLAGPNASTRLLERLGMRFEGGVHDPDDGDVWRWAMDRRNAVATDEFDAVANCPAAGPEQSL